MIDTLPLAQWLTFDSVNPAPTFFARPAWALALQDATPGLLATPLRASVNGRTYVLPTVRGARGRMPFAEYLGFPLGTYTCVLDDNGALAPQPEASLAIARIARHSDHLKLVPWPLGGHFSIPSARATRHETAVIDCRNGVESALGAMRGVTRRMAQQASRRGVTCLRAPAAELPRYFALLEIACTRWGMARPHVSYQLLESVLHRGGDDAQLWFALLGGKAIAGALVLFGSRELFFWSAAMDHAFGRYRPSNALNVALIEAACKRGVSWFNLGASEGLEGVARFKADLGAISVPYYQLTIRRPAFALCERLRTTFRTRVSAC